MGFFNNFPYTNFHQLNLDWIIGTINELLANMDTNNKNVAELTEYVRDYFKNLDVSNEINNKLDDMAKNGTLAELISIYLENVSITVFNTVEEMKRSTTLSAGSAAMTKGFYTPGIGGSFYRIENPSTTISANGANIIAIDKGLLAIRNSSTYNVLELGAYGDGIHDDYIAFYNCYKIAPRGSTIKIPYGKYYLSENPDNGSNSVIWDADSGCEFSGPGLGSPGTGHGTFMSPYLTNPWLLTRGKNARFNISDNVSPTGGALIGESFELMPDEQLGFPVRIRGTITRGSYTMTNISNIDLLEPGYAILTVTNIGGWGGTGTRNCMRVISVNKKDKSCTFGLDDGTGSGVGVLSPWSGASYENAEFEIRKRAWYSMRYEGVVTGNVDNIDTNYEICNPVMNITGCKGIMYEMDLNSYAKPAGFSTALFITGGGTVKSDMSAIDITRDSWDTRWTTAISVRNAETAFFCENVETGFQYGKVNRKATPGIAIQQKKNGADGIVVRRFTDNSPSGNLIVVWNAAENDELFAVGVDGSVRCKSISAKNIDTGLQRIRTLKEGTFQNQEITININVPSGKKILLASEVASIGFAASCWVVDVNTSNNTVKIFINGSGTGSVGVTCLVG